MKKQPLRDLPNIGATLEKKLHEIGIFSLTDLQPRNPAVIYGRLCAKGGKRLPVCYYLYSLVGAIRGIDWRTLSEFEKQKLLKDVREAR